ncbi:M23 family metallopeptidase [Membranihabitans marinus]|uniref:M23 family metallopeptidase n=1 Tax=Membranihabitans marinus TaxID=1227546 RepID=UPI001F190DFE|nr:M23 family metallopeptidase [Membranihabitans marinus]
MSKEKFVFNPHTLRYEKVKVPFSRKIFIALGFLLSAIVLGFATFFFLSSSIPSLNFKEKELKKELTQMEIKFKLLNSQLGKMSSVLENLHQRNSNIQEIVFGTEPLDANVWNGGIGGHQQYNELINFNSKDLLIETLNKADQLSRKLTLQSKELDDLEKKTIEREEMLNSLPSIKPVQEDKLKRKVKYLSGFGMRLHPIHKIAKMHEGIDFTAPSGTKIQATGNGTVIRVEKRSTGYGYNVMIDHGYDYKTLYAHMKEIYVKKGQKVKKGELLGLIGDTGSSTAPHLHYEVRYKDKAVNPIQFVMDGLSPEEYDQLVKMASESNKSLD